jgi:exonuclease VII large subunit
VPQQWADGKKRRIEDCLNSIADVLAEIVDRLVRRRAENEEWERTRPERERQRAEDERQRAEIARLQAEEEKRIDNLRKQAAAWEQASSIRRFVAAVRDEATRRCTQEPGSLLEKWIQWAEAHADKIDPVLPLLAEKVREPQVNKPA